MAVSFTKLSTADKEQGMTIKEKIKVLTISDHPLSPSGVGTQTRYIIEALLDSGSFQVVSLGGAIKHQSYQPQKTDKYKDDWVIFPVNGYGNQDMIRSLLRTEKPDVIWFMTDPRFYGWLWSVAQEVRPLVPLVYYHVWDNFPAPVFNKKFYDSNDKIFTISKVTDRVVKEVTDKPQVEYLPHAVHPDIFSPVDAQKKAELRSDMLSKRDQDKFIVFWNNRNARRKMSGSVLYWFAEWAKKVGTEKVSLIMHTDPKDVHGQDLVYMTNDLGLTDGTIQLSTQKMPPEALAQMYQISDVVVNIADAEGFGLATLESLSCGVPIIVNMTGGLQEQVTDGESWFGVGIEPSSKAIIGSQDVPYIYEDRVSKEDFLSALDKMYEMSPEERQELGLAGRGHVEKNYGFENFKQRWVEAMTEIHEEMGSWNDRVGYKSWEVITL